MRKAVIALAAVVAALLTMGAGGCQPKTAKTITVIQPDSAACTESEREKGRTTGVAYSVTNTETGASEGGGITCFTPDEVQRQGLKVGDKLG